MTKANTEITFKINNRDVEKYLNERTFMSISKNCYTVMAGDIGSLDYTVYYRGKKLNDVQGVIRMAHLSDQTKCVVEPINWRKVIENELNK